MQRFFFIILLLIGYGSLYPFEFQYIDLTDFNWLEWLFTWEHRTTRGDILGNVLLFIPYGLFGFLWLRDQSKRTAKVDAAMLICAGLIYALLLQIIQIYLPSRVATAGDAVTNLVGIVLGVFFAKVVSSSTASRWLKQDELTHHLSPALILCLCWLGYLWFPFIPSFDWQQIKNSVKPVMDWSSLSGFSMLDRWLLWSVFWILLDQLMGWHLKIWHRLGFFTIVLLGQIIILRHLMSNASLIGAVISIGSYRYFTRIRVKHMALLLLFWLVVRGLFPFGLNRHLHEFSWVPFSGYLKGSLWFNSYVLFEKLFLYGSSFYYLNLWLKNGLRAALILASLLLCVELLQIGIGEHYPGMTDPLIALLLALGLSHMQIDSQQWGNNKKL